MAPIKKYECTIQMVLARATTEWSTNDTCGSCIPSVSVHSPTVVVAAVVVVATVVVAGVVVGIGVVVGS